MSLIAMAIFSTEENGKDEYLEQTLQSLQDTVADDADGRVVFGHLHTDCKNEPNNPTPSKKVSDCPK